MVLELMDTRFSTTYKEGLAQLLAEALEDHAGLIEFIGNRLLTSPLPDAFNPKMALQMLSPFAPVAANVFYDDLANKVAIFANFYTLFVTAINVEREEEQQIRKTLTENGNFKLFTYSLYRQSAHEYRVAATRTVTTLKTNGIYTADIDFPLIARQLEHYYKVRFTENDAKQKYNNVLFPIKPGLPVVNVFGPTKSGRLIPWHTSPVSQKRLKVDTQKKDHYSEDYDFFLKDIFSALTEKDLTEEKSVLFLTTQINSKQVGLPVAVINCNKFTLRSEVFYVTGQIKTQFPDTKILSYFLYRPEAGQVVQMMGAGVTGFLCDSDVSIAELQNALSAVEDNKFYFSADIVKTIPGRKTLSGKLLSQSEMKVLNLITQEYTTKEIADQFSINMKSLEKPSHPLFAKLKAFFSSIKHPIVKFQTVRNQITKG
jgi:hypothetical protein